MPLAAAHITWGTKKGTKGQGQTYFKFVHLDANYNGQCNSKAQDYRLSEICTS